MVIFTSLLVPDPVFLLCEYLIRSFAFGVWQLHRACDFQRSVAFSQRIRDTPVRPTGDLWFGGPCETKACLDDPVRAAEAIDARAYVAIRSRLQLRENELLQWSRKRIAQYKVPRILRIVPGQPRSPGAMVLPRPDCAI